MTALKTVSVRSLLHEGHLQLDLFDDCNLFEFSSPDYPNERLVACHNPQRARQRAHKREELLCATEDKLEKIRAQVQTGKLLGEDKIGVKVGKVVNQYKVAKHFELKIKDSAFSFARHADSIASEAALDDLCIIRTSVAEKQLDSASCVRHYKLWANVERAFRSFKGVDLKGRLIHHWLENRVRAHLFLCMLAYHVEWHLREAWRELMFADTDQQAKATRDPVALRKVSTRTLDDETPTHSFATLLTELSTIVRNSDRYDSWNIKHFHEHYQKHHQGNRSYTWVKQRLQTAGLVKSVKRRGPHRLRRERKPLPGMMVHQDASTHAWVPNQMWDLIVTMDDATSEIYSAFFVDEEGTWSSLQGVRETLEAKGLFSSFYSDRGSHYWHTPEAGGKVDKMNPTQFGRGMKAAQG